MPKVLALFLLPFIASLVMFMLPIAKKNAKRLALFLSLFPLFFLFIDKARLLGRSIKYDWFPTLNIHFDLQIDSVSYLFLALVAFITPFSILAVKDSFNKSHIYFGAVFALEGLLFGFFMANDLVFFMIFWEAMLLPLYFMINEWGGEKRQQASLKFIIYTLAGSSLMAAAVLGLYFSFPPSPESFNLASLAQKSSSATYAPWIFGVFLLAFAVKTPLFPFHAWLPDTYTQAPFSATILLSALLSKAGIYGIYRIGIGLFPLQMQQWSIPLLSLAIIGVLYGGLIAWRQTDYKRLLAYSSFSHVNFILAGLFVWNDISHSGAIFQALSHGIVITGLFLVASWLEDRIHTTAIYTHQGLAAFFPYLCWITLFFVLASIALPGTNTFIGELTILYGVFENLSGFTVALALSVILSAIYMLRWMQKTYFETPTDQEIHQSDLSYKEILITLPLMFLILWMGMQPMPVLKLSTAEQPKPISTALLKEIP